jgi:hypothetical protein
MKILKFGLASLGLTLLSLVLWMAASGLLMGPMGVEVIR